MSMKNIAGALVKAQKAFGPALKSSTNPHFKSKYADLAACVEAVIDGLNENGVYLMQACHESENGVTVETLLIHESGEQISAGRLHVPASKQDPQGYGSALTYARRYSLMAACGIAPEDDDGNAGTKAAGTEKKADPWADFTHQQKTKLRDAGQRAITSFLEGKDWAAWEEYSTMLDKASSTEIRNQMKLCFWEIFANQSALKTYLTTCEDQLKEHK